MLAKLKIPQKLALIIGVLLAALAAVAGYGLHGLQAAQEQAARHLETERDLLSASQSARAAAVAWKAQQGDHQADALRGHDPRDGEQLLAALLRKGETVRQELAAVKAVLSRRAPDSATADGAMLLHARLVQQYEADWKKRGGARPEGASVPEASPRQAEDQLGRSIAAVMVAIDDLRRQEEDRLGAASARQWERAGLTFALLLLLAVPVALCLSHSVQMHVLLPVRRAAAAARSIADGDLTAAVQVSGSGELAKMLRALSDMAGQLRLLVGEVAASAHSVADTSAQIAQGNLDLSQRTEEQASTLEETSSALEALTATVARNAETARQAAALASGASEVARRGGRAVGDVVDTMTAISAASSRIGDISGVIDDIAFQTNILALNAAVEAARAGEQGRGFAVVAAEVRSLAQRSAAASREIKVLIGDAAQKVQAGTKQVDAAGRTMQEIVAAVEKVSALISEIAAASLEQRSGIEQVNTAMLQMDRVVQQNAALVEEAAAATESMKERAAGLLRLVARFKIRAADGAAAQPTAGPALAYEGSVRQPGRPGRTWT